MIFNPTQYKPSNPQMNPNDSELKMIQTEFSIRITPTSDSLGLKKWLGLIWIISDTDIVRRPNFHGSNFRI